MKSRLNNVALWPEDDIGLLRISRIFGQRFGTLFKLSVEHDGDLRG
jgi:hypothetical protein